MESDVVEITNMEMELNKKIKVACKRDRSHIEMLNQ